MSVGRQGTLRRMGWALVLGVVLAAGVAAETARIEPAAAGRTGGALDLAQAYRLAVGNDPTLRAAQAAARARAERVPQALAQMLPNVRASFGRYRNGLDSTSPGLFGAPLSEHIDYWSSTRALVLRQPVYRPYQMADYRQALAEREEGEARLAEEGQGLAVRLATAYLQVLASQDQLALALAQKRAYLAQLDAARRRMEAGAGTRTDIDEAQARLDMALARELEAGQNLGYTRQQLQVLIGDGNAPLVPLDPDRLPLAVPEPQDVQAWIARAEQGNLQIRALQAQLEAARQEVGKQQAGHLPTIDAVAQRSIAHSDNVTRVGTRYSQMMGGVEINVPLFNGGYVAAGVRRAVAERERIEESLEAARRDLGLRVYKEYRGVSEGVLRTRALEQAVRSAETAVLSSRRAYAAGARTQLDVLQAEESRVSALRDLANARYDYVLARISLRALAGEADAGAIAEANSWLAPARP